MGIGSINNYSYLYGNYGFYSNNNVFSGQKSSGLMDLYTNLYSNLNNTIGSGISASMQSDLNIKDLGQSLKAAMNGLTGNKSGQGAFDQLIAVSSDSNTVTAVVDSKKANSNTLKDTTFDIQINQIAKAQVNSGDSVKSSEKSLSSGSYGFSIEIGGKTHLFNISVSAADNNDSIQQKMASAINSRNIGVTAAITSNTADKTSKLSVSASETGTSDIKAPVFKIKDTTGNSASAMGITDITQAAQNAVYSVNGGVQKTSKSNNVDLGNGVTATLKDSVAGMASLSFKPDNSVAVSVVKDLVKSLNSALTESWNTSGKRFQELASAISGMNKAYKPALEMIGINVSKDGYMSVDEKKLQAASEDGSLQKFFRMDNGSVNYGFAARAQKISGDMASGHYAGNTSVSSYSRISSGYFASVYSKYSSYSSLFDVMF